MHPDAQFLTYIQTYIRTSYRMVSAVFPSNRVLPLWLTVCGALAPFCAIIVFLAPIPTIQQINKEKAVGSLPLLPYSTMIASCFLWVLYGLLRHESKIWATNGIGLVLGTYYFVQFVRRVPRKSAASFPGSILSHFYAIGGIVGVTTALCYVLQDPATIIGDIAVLFCMLLFASPLAALRTVIRERSARSIPLPFTIATIINCFLWSLLGLFDMHDINVYLPNLVGLAFGLAQLGLKLVYGDGKTSPMETKLDTIL